jgi:hypothetical protein
MGARTEEAEWPMAPWETRPIPIPSEAQAPTVPAALPARPALSPSLSLPSPPSLPAPPAAARAPWEDAPEPGDPGPTGSHLGMPIRVPQASMAPQLRAPRDADAPGQPGQPGPWPDEDEDPGFGARSPEATRSMLTMMQQGWRRGRMDDLDDPGGAPGIRTD